MKPLSAFSFAKNAPFHRVIFLNPTLKAKVKFFSLFIQSLYLLQTAALFHSIRPSV